MKKTERDLVRQAAQLVAITDSLRQQGLGQGRGQIPRPIHWPSVKTDEIPREWTTLRAWVEQLRARFPNAIRLPECWWRHNDLVEVLAALRDYEAACFADTSAATGPVEWQRALRDMETRMEVWTKRFTCTMPGRGHDPPAPALDPPPGWDEFIEQDTRRRDAVSGPPPSEASSDR